jgi:hypothetical protein
MFSDNLKNMLSDVGLAVCGTILGILFLIPPMTPIGVIVIIGSILYGISRVRTFFNS